MIGWYVHHVGRGHLHHALAIADRLGRTGHRAELAAAPGRLARRLGPARAATTTATIVDPTRTASCTGRRCTIDGLQRRMADDRRRGSRGPRPRALVVDVSVEVAALARLFGVPVVTFCLPGVRTDRSAPAGVAISRTPSSRRGPRRFSGLCTGLERSPRQGVLHRCDLALRRPTHPRRRGGPARRRSRWPRRIGPAECRDAPGWTWTRARRTGVVPRPVAAAVARRRW